MIDKIKSKLNDFLALAVVIIFALIKIVLMIIGIGVIWKLLNLIPVPDWNYDGTNVASSIVSYLSEILGYESKPTTNPDKRIIPIKKNWNCLDSVKVFNFFCIATP